MTVSAHARICGGISRPSAFAVLIYEELEFARLFDRQVSRLSASQDLVDVGGGAPM
jgi:hypothetical protein